MAYCINLGVQILLSLLKLVFYLKFLLKTLFKYLHIREKAFRIYKIQ
jgi:hypothetical protein